LRGCYTACARGVGPGACVDLLSEVAVCGEVLDECCAPFGVQAFVDGVQQLALGDFPLAAMPQLGQLLLVLLVLMKRSMAAMRSAMVGKLPGRSAWRVMIEKNASTR
jgi:hypothetical protein